MKRKQPLKRKNPARLAALRARQFGVQADLCRKLPCLLCGHPPPSDPAHVRSRGAGGLDRENVIPLCRACHDRQHLQGWRGRLDYAMGAARAFGMVAYP